jgi:hypothetical protein
MWSTHKHRFSRICASGSPILLGGGAAMITALATVAVAYLTPAPNNTTVVSVNPILFVSLLVGVTVGLVALALQWRADYKKRTYDPTWVLEFGKIFNADEMKKTRAKAASALKHSQSKLKTTDFSSSEVDNVLDFLEDLGFYLRGDQMTPEVVHHAFHYWIRGYYNAARGYLEMVQEKEPTCWEHVSYLFEVSHEIEMERSKSKHQKHLDQSSLNRFLDKEIALCPKD